MQNIQNFRDQVMQGRFMSMGSVNQPNRHTAQVTGRVVTNPPLPAVAELITQNAGMTRQPLYRSGNLWNCCFGRRPTMCASSFPNDASNRVFYIQPSFTKIVIQTVVKYNIYLPKVDYESIIIRASGKRFKICAPVFRKLYRNPSPAQIANGFDPNKKVMYFRRLHEYILQDSLPGRVAKFAGNPVVLFLGDRVIVTIKMVSPRYW